jgi:hypothetical protein
VRAALLAVLLGAGAIMSAFRLASPGLFGLAPFSAVVGICARAPPRRPAPPRAACRSPRSPSLSLALLR